MKYFKNPAGEVFGYDEVCESDLPYIEQAINSGWEDVTGSWPPAPPAPNYDELLAAAKSVRAAAYREEADPIFFKSQRGEATHEDWLAKVQEIKTRYPDPKQA